jgi:Ca2+/Na+ antiporter
MFSIYVLFEGFHGAYHSMGLVGISLLFASIKTKKDTGAFLALMGLIVFNFAGVYTALMFSNNFTLWTVTLIISLISYVIFLILEIVKNSKAQQGHS